MKVQHLQFAPYVHHVLLNGELTILHEPRDQYYLLSQDQTREVLSQFDPSMSTERREQEYSPLCQNLINEGVLICGDIPEQIRIVEAERIGIGCYSAESYISQGKRSTLATTCAFAILILTKASLAVLGLHRTLQLCRRIARKAGGESTQADPVRLSAFIDASRAASAWLPFKAKCMERSVAVFLWARSQRIRCTFKIGVQRYDFLAHAWVASDAGPLGERPDLEDRLPLILEI